MSRGLGKVQRGIIAALRKYKALDIHDLAAQVYLDDSSSWKMKEQHAAIRRALISLHRRGLVQRGHRHRPPIRLHHLIVDRFLYTNRRHRRRTLWRERDNRRPR
jgi:predicted transcriptional regulator